MGKHAIGIDIGGTNIRVGLVNDQLELIRKETMFTNRCRDAEDMLQHIRTMIERVNSDQRADRIGVALPVPWNDQTETIVDVTNIPYLEGTSVRRIRAFFPEYHMCFGNDVNVIALLESAVGAASGSLLSMYITVSTGIGSGIIYRNEIFGGAHGYAGEIGGMIMSGRTLEDRCSGLTLEGVSRRLYGSEATAELLFAKARQGEKEAASVVSEWVEHFSDAIASLIQTIDPDIFVFGGAVIHHNPWLIDQVKGCARGKVMLEHLRDRIKIVRPKFGSDAGVIGAGFMAYRQGD